ncbi:MAG: VWA domain-containing protein [Rhodanobacter sp.]
MAEAEDVVLDAARHATIYARALWLRYRPPVPHPPPLALAVVAPRLDLLISALYDRSVALRIAQTPAPPTFLALLVHRRHGPRHRGALPATDGMSIWLPANLGQMHAELALRYYRALALQQAARAVRGTPAHAPDGRDPLLRDLYLLCEAAAADSELACTLPGVADCLRELRGDMLQARPTLSIFPAHLQPVEALLRAVLAAPFTTGSEIAGLGLPCTTPAESLQRARQLAMHLRSSTARQDWGPHPLLKDLWTGELRAPPTSTPGTVLTGNADPFDADRQAARSARLPRRPDVRTADDEEDDERPGAWMVQTAQPHEQAEDPGGLQRPTDRDDSTAADEYADALSELPEARLLTRPGRPKEVLLSNDPPDAAARVETGQTPGADHALSYPEWDYRLRAYHAPGATVHLLPAAMGPQAWVEHTLNAHRGMLHEIRRRFEMLRARRIRVHRQLDGDEVDLEAYIEGQADYHAGLPLPQRLYQSQRRVQRDMAIMLLIDVSGSTDGWIVGNRRIIDVEREALLLVCIALEGLGQPYAVQAFSGETAQGVIVREVKRFDEPYGADVARRIAGLEPENYTRAGAAVRHASNRLMQQPAQHRLLLLLSDGKPNDMDHYEGRYGVEDLCQAVTEAKLQGISPFCLTIDRQAANYLPFVFGANQYALLPKPELLPTVLLDWLRRLVGH